jgi:hypothetical protein
VNTDDKKLTTSIDIYEGDFHDVKITPDRFLKAGSMFIVDPEYVKLSELRPLHMYDLAKVGDSIRKQLIWELTLEVCDERAHAYIADLN